MTSEKLLRLELIGLELKVDESTNRNIIGLSGKIVDETRNTLKIETGKGVRILVKEQCTFILRSKDYWR